MPAERADTGTVRAHPELFAEAAALRLELPGRSAAQIASILYHRHGIAVSERTVRGQLRRAGLHREALAAEPKAYGRYEAGAPNERWITDVLVGPWVPWPRREGSARARLFLIVDDHSRLLVDGRFFAHENARACQDLLRRAITRRGVPQVLYADNGAPFSNAWLARTCGVLGIRLVHEALLAGRAGEAGEAQPLYPGGVPGRGHPPRYRVPGRAQRPVRRVGRAGRQPAGARRDRPDPDRPVRGERPAPPGRPRTLLREAFRWSVTRRVTRTATVPLEGNAYAVDPALAGRRVELRYDPEDLTRIDVFLDGKPAGAATPFITRRHVHRAVPQAARPDPAPTGIDYLGLVAAAHDEEAGTGAKIDFTQLGKLPASEPGQEQEQERDGEPGAVGRALRADPHPVRQVHRRPGPVRPPGPRRGDRPDQLLRGGIGAGSGHGGRRGGQDGGAARRGRRASTRPGTRSSTSPTRRSAPGACMSPSSGHSAPGRATSRPS